MAEVKVNYTEAMVERMLELYAELGNDGIETIAAELKRPVRSVRSKLVREGVYVAASKAEKPVRNEGPTKKELLNLLETLVDFDVKGLDGATKEAIVNVIGLARQVDSVEAESEAESEEEGEAESA